MQCRVHRTSRSRGRPEVQADSGEVARSYGLVAQTVGNWVAKWRTEHPDHSPDGTTAEEHAEIRRLKAEFREARMEAEFLKKAAALVSPWSPG
ncbi:transposase [Propionibacterium australiense]|uniref:transposase n=1 Tax=Propionibacterium australiense TaxID=119981 RepID=UPI0035C6CD71